MSFQINEPKTLRYENCVDASSEFFVCATLQNGMSSAGRQADVQRSAVPTRSLLQFFSLEKVASSWDSGSARRKLPLKVASNKSQVTSTFTGSAKIAADDF